MKYPNFREEKKLWRKGYKIVAGLDESGCGPLAGPVVAATVCFKKNPKSNIYNLNSRLYINTLANQGSRAKREVLISNLKDSKKLSPKKREEFYKILANHPQIEWGIGRVSEKVIDRINILEATKLAMKRAIGNLKSKKQKVPTKSRILDKIGTKGKIDYLILDGNFKINVNIPQKSIIKADEKVFSCAAASVLAKVTRDRIMIREHKKYSQYGFDKHKGYPTKLHRKMLKKYGPSIIHRLTFSFLKKSNKIKIVKVNKSII